MARYTGPKCKLCRRERTKLFLKGAKCLSPKCPVVRRNQPPGQHGAGIRNSKLTDFARHLREKQKVKRIYGVLEKQFQNYFQEASRKKGVTGEVLLQLLERRLDSVIYNAGVAHSRAEARRRINNKEFIVNGKEVTVPSYNVMVGDVITSKKNGQSFKAQEEIQEWINFDTKKNEIKVVGLPTRDQLSYEIKEELIVEYYSR